MGALIAASLAVALLVAPANEVTGPEQLVAEAREHHDRAYALLGVKAYGEAAAEFARAHAIESAPFLLFMQAGAEQLAGNCDVAISLFGRFIASGPPQRDVDAAKGEIAKCGGDPDAFEPEPEPQPQLAPEPVLAPVYEPTDDDRPVPRRTAARDPLAHALTWSGVAVGGVGAILLIEAHRRRRTAGGVGVTESQHRALLEPAVPMSRAGIALASIGGAALLAGIVRFAVVSRSAGRRSRSAAWWAPQRRPG